MRVLKEEDVKRIKEDIAPLYDDVKSAIIPALWVVQRAKGWVSEEAITDVAEILGVSTSIVYDTLTFYTMFNRASSGKYHLYFCTNLTCRLLGSEDLLKTAEEILSIKPGEVTPDGIFALSTVECLGACGGAPVVQINDDYYENLTPETLKEIIEKLRKGGA